MQYLPKLGAFLALGCSFSLALAQTLTTAQQSDDTKRTEREEVQREKQKIQQSKPLQPQDSGLLRYTPSPARANECLIVDANTWLVPLPAESPASGTQHQLVRDVFPVLGKVLAHIQASLQDQCVHKDDAKLLADYISAQMQRMGYALVAPIKMRLGDNSRRLQVTLQVPRVRHITVQQQLENAQDSSPDLPVHTVQHLLGVIQVGDVFNSFALDQAIENARHSAGADLLVRVRQNPNDSDEVTVEALHVLDARMTVTQELSNSSAEELHKVQSLIGLSAYRLLSDTDSLQMRVSATPYDFRGAPNQRSISLDYSFAYGYWIWGLGLRRSVSRNQVTIGVQQFPYYSLTRSLTARAEGVLYRTPSEVLRLKLSAGKRHTDATLDGQTLDVQQRRLASVSLGLNWRFQGGDSYTDLDVSHNSSPKIFGAQEDFALPAGAGPGPSFRSAFYSLSLYRSSVLGTLAGINWVHDLFLQAQFSSRAQYNSDQFQIGSQGTVRGFSARISANGEQGFSLRNEAQGRGCISGTVTCYVALDVGRITRNIVNPELQGSLAGMTVGAKGGLGVWYWDVSVSKAVSHSARFGSIDKGLLLAVRSGLRVSL
jgi:hemolysin activation/secretion protein